MSNFLYSVEREVSHPIAKLWHAWTDAAALEAWYHGVEHGSIPGLTESDFRVGGVWAVTIDVPQYGMVAYFFGKYLSIDPMKSFEHSMHYTESLEDFKAKDFSTPAHRVLVEFEDRGEASWVRFSQYGELPEGQAEQAQAGMESYLDSLERFLA